MRLPKPAFLLEYEKLMADGPPKCCHTCDHYGGNGECLEFRLIPPPEFVNLRDSCPVYSRICPF